MMELTFPTCIFCLFAGIIAILTIRRFKNLQKSNTVFDIVPRLGSRYASTYEIVAPMVLTKRNMPLDARIYERMMAIVPMSNGAPIVYINFAFEKYFIVLKASNAKHILKCKENVQKPPVLFHFIKVWLRNGLLTSDEKIWRERRKALAPTLHQKVVESYFDVFYENSLILASNLNSNVNKATDIIPLMGFCTLDIVLETSTGVKMGIQINKDSKYLQCIDTLVNSVVLRIVKPWYWFDCTFKYFHEGKRYFEALNYTRKFTMKVIENRKKVLVGAGRNNHSEDGNNVLGSKLSRKSFLDMVLEMHLRDKSLTLEDVQDEIETLLLGGHDTSSLNMSFALYLLGLNKDCLDKVHAELDRVFGTDPDTPIDMDQIKNLTYLECVIKEAARLYPPGTAILRTLLSDLRIDDNIVIPKGNNVGIAVMAVHRDPDMYPDPERFIPERFLPNAENPINPYAFLTFSAGPRGCPGLKFAMLEMKIVLSTVLRRFNVHSLFHRDKIIMSFGLIQKPIGGLPLVFTLRNQSLLFN